MASSSSRERMLGAIEGGPEAPIPCSFMIFRALRARCADEFEFARRQMELGLDARVQLDDLPISFPPEVAITEWQEEGLLHRAYKTPAGTLTATCKHTDDWPYATSIPIFDDWFSPRAVKYPVTGPDDLPALRSLLAPPTAEEVAEFREQAAARKKFAREHGLLFTGGWKSQRFVSGEDKLLVGDNGGTGTVIDTLMWLCGGTEPLLWAFDQPDFLRELIGVVEEWNRARLALHLEAGVDLVMRRAWYEGTEFWSPKLYREFILPGLAAEVEMAHQAGAKFGYIITSGVTAIADLILESGADVMVGVDPGEGKGTSLAEVRDLFGGRIGLWGLLGPTGRFILCPVDNVRADTENAWRNVKVFIETWRFLTEGA